MKQAKISFIFLLCAVIFLAGCKAQSQQTNQQNLIENQEDSQQVRQETNSQDSSGEEMIDKIITGSAEQTSTKQEPLIKHATFAGGCFWCMEPPFENAPGVLRVTSGYTGGDLENPAYKQVSAGGTGHIESVEIEYDASIIRYDQLLDIFWRNIDPTDDGGQFVDRGYQYTTAIFYHDEEQKRIAEESKAELEGSGVYDAPIVTQIIPAKEFYDAEEYHQDYYKKNPVRYKTYRHLSGRDQYLEETWGNDPHGKEAYVILDFSEENDESSRVANEEEDSSPSSYSWSAENFVKPTDEELKEQLTAMQYKVTQQDSTERAFENEYWDNKEEGIYVDIVSGEPLFSSTTKYESGTGWPSFYEPISEDFIVTQKDHKLFLPRTEVRSAIADSHLGHVFTDGPEPTGLRYCMNSAALRFVPKAEMEQEGYAEYLKLFE